MATLRDRINQAIDKLTSSDDAQMLVYGIVEAAARYWVGFDPMDFCIQSIGPETVVFGSTNRIVWSPFIGFIASHSHCNSKFIENYNKIGNNPISPVVEH